MERDRGFKAHGQNSENWWVWTKSIQELQIFCLKLFQIKKFLELLLQAKNKMTGQ